MTYKKGDRVRITQQARDRILTEPTHDRYLGNRYWLDLTGTIVEDQKPLWSTVLVRWDGLPKEFRFARDLELTGN